MDKVAILVLAVTAFLLFWMAILELLSRAGGWKRTARRYAATSRPEGDSRSGCKNSTLWVGRFTTAVLQSSSRPREFTFHFGCCEAQPSRIADPVVGTSCVEGEGQRPVQGGRVGRRRAAPGDAEITYKVVEAAERLMPALN